MADRILVAFDESPQAHAALRYALSTFPEAEIVVLHVSDPREWVFGDAFGYGYYSKESFDRAHEEAEELLAEATALAEDGDVETVSVTGPVAGTIVSYAERNDVDHVVLGSHGRRGLTRFLLGSVAETVARRSPVSVTIVREETDDS